MLVVEQHLITPQHRYYSEIDKLCFLSKNLYNSIIYLLRQEWFVYKKFKLDNQNIKYQWTNYAQIAKQWAAHKQPDYAALLAKVSQQVLKQGFNSFSSFRALVRAFIAKKIDRPPQLPRYKDKNGRNIVVYTAQAISKVETVDGLRLYGSNIFIRPLTKNKIHQVRLVPVSGGYKIEIVYERYCKRRKANDRYAAIDIGLNNLAAVTFNTGDAPILVSGRPLKSINQFYNKRKGEYQSQLDAGKHWSKRLDKLAGKRRQKISDYLHKASRVIINYLVSHDISTLIIGRNAEWKQGINLGKKNNQNFVSVPFYTFIHMLTYKAKLAGIKVVLQEESYTSKCSFLDQESIEKHSKYVGRRSRRGLFKTANRVLINADLNGSANIMRKAIPKIKFINGLEAVVVQPRRVKTSEKIKWIT